MKPFDHHEKQIIEKLKQLPMVDHKLDKDELYQRVSRRMHNTRPKPNPLKKLIPILSTVFVVALLFIMVPSLFGTNKMESQNEILKKESYDMASENSSADKEESSSDAKITMDQNDSSEIGIASKEEKKAENVEEGRDQESERYIVEDVNENQTVVYAALADNQAQYVIPFAMIVSTDTMLEDSYNELASHLNEEEWGVSSYLFSDVHFEIDQENRQVIMNFPADFSLGDGSANAGLFEDILSMMFKPVNIEKVIFKTPDGQGVDLGPYGVLDEMDLPDILANYKLYQTDDQNRTFLIPIPQEEIPIEDALNDLKNGNEAFNVFQTVPENIQFSVQASENKLTLEFLDHAAIDQDEGITMIESILMTAKSYGYEFVSFNNLPAEQIGPYPLTAPIKVPAAVNPIDQ